LLRWRAFGPVTVTAGFSNRSPGFASQALTALFHLTAARTETFFPANRPVFFVH
jgi:hypothetical protein